jgi:hypothetical protein
MWKLSCVLLMAIAAPAGRVQFAAWTIARLRALMFAVLHEHIHRGNRREAVWTSIGIRISASGGSMAHNGRLNARGALGKFTKRRCAGRERKKRRLPTVAAPG